MNITDLNDVTSISNPVIEALLNRRSCRSYKPDPIDLATLEVIITCGQYAATARGGEPWHITVIEDKDLVDRIDEAVKSGMRDSKEERLVQLAESDTWHCFQHAPALVIISRQDGEDYGDIDCANVAQNVCIAAHSLGIGSCYNGFFRWAFRSDKATKLREELRIPEGYTPTVSVVLGYPDQPITGNPRRDDAKIDYLNR